MNAQLTIYGDPTDIAIFEEQKTNYLLENGKLLSKEPYSEELLKIYDESFTTDTKKVLEYTIGDEISGTIAQISKEDILLDLGGKEFAYISIEKDKLNPQSFKIGEELDALVIDNSDYLKASVVEYTKAVLYSEMKDINNRSVYEATVISLTENGYILDIDGVKVFMPGSLGGINKLLDFHSLIGKTIKVIPITNENNYSKFKDQLIVSHRAYLETLIPLELDKLEIAEVYTGIVTGTKPFGTFVEFNATKPFPNDMDNVLTGMIHKDDFDDHLIELFEEGKVLPGTAIDFYLKEIVNPRKIILSRLLVDPNLDSKSPTFEKGDIVDGKVVKTVKYGSFVSIGRNTVGLIHISKLHEDDDLSKGDKVKVKILNVKGDKYDLELA